MEDKTMKKVFGIAALLLALAACNKETEITPVEQPSDSKGITITATLAPKTADTKAVTDNGDNKITVTWAENEHIAILYDKDGAQVADATITAVDGTTGAATISFTVVSGTADNTACTLVYPYSAAKDDNSGVKAYADMLAAQDGVLDGDLDVRVGAGTIQTSTPSLTVTTQPEAQFAIFKFTLSGPTINASHPLVIKKGENDVVTTVTPASSTTSVYVAMPPAASSTYKFFVKTNNNKYIKSGTATIDAGKYYQTTLTMEPRYPLALSSATADDLGAVVCDDGKMYMEKKAVTGTAVGILGKVTATGHGLILALKDAATQQKWSTINSWDSETTYAGTTLKQLPDDDARSPLTSYTTLGSTAVSNWAVAQKSDYEAIFINLGSTTGDTDGKTYDANVNAYITTFVGGTAISGYYWSATERDDGYVCFFGSAYWIATNNKSSTYHVRACLAF